MKKITLILSIVICLVIGYVLGNFFPFDKIFSKIESEENIQGDTQLTVTAKMAGANTPVPNLEIDLAEEPGPPPVGGIALTDESGIAKFNVQPGTYLIYFNQANFPENLIAPESEQITVSEGAVNKKEIVFFTK
jgi:uncharacterized protein YneF (UPF0154 family)